MKIRNRTKNEDYFNTPNFWFKKKDGSVIKSIAFNAKSSPLEPFLSKNNKKRFNIAGKMNLNEWRGRKNIEFIIDDISLK